MNRENAGAKPTAPPRLPPEAEQEILEALFVGVEIHSSGSRIFSNQIRLERSFPQ